MTRRVYMNIVGKVERKEKKRREKGRDQRRAKEKREQSPSSLAAT